MRKLVWLLMLAVLVSCQDQPKVEQKQEPIENLPVKSPKVEKPFTVNDPEGKEITWNKDGAQMVLIPAGSFRMGANDPENWMKDAQPVHTVELDAFYMDVYEVTVGQYKQFLKATGHRDLPDWISEFSPTDDHPVVGVSWDDAQAYAKWARKRLPTEAEWEYAARGSLKGKRYLWGNTKPNGRQCNYADKNADATLRQMDEDWTHADMSVDDGYTMTAPVGRYSPNSYGLYDLAGNVYEWCADWHGENYYSKSALKNPTGPRSGENKVLRGGAWSNSTGNLRVAYRDGTNPNTRFNYCGFRCVSGSD